MPDKMMSDLGLLSLTSVGAKVCSGPAKILAITKSAEISGQASGR